MLACLWRRSRLEAFADGALDGRVARSMAAHTTRCERCRRQVESLTMLRALVRSASDGPAEPSWSAFWPAIQSRIASEPARPFRDPWWLPWWKPVWGHPRLAASGALAVGVAGAFALWPASQEPLLASSTPIVVQDVATTDPRDTVMVYSPKEQDMAVIWLFAAARDE